MSKNIKIVVSCQEGHWPIYRTYFKGELYDSKESFEARYAPDELIADAIDVIMQSPELNYGKDGFEIEFDGNDYYVE